MATGETLAARGGGALRLGQELFCHAVFLRGQAFSVSLAKRSPRALAIAKQAMRSGAESTLAGHLEFTLQAQSILLASEDFAEAATAMTERRPAVY